MAGAARFAAGPGGTAASATTEPRRQPRRCCRRAPQPARRARPRHRRRQRHRRRHRARLRRAGLPRRLRRPGRGRPARALAAASPNTHFEACDVTRRGRAAAPRMAALLQRLGGVGRAGQQRRQRPAPCHRRGHARVLRRAHRAQPAAALLRHPGRAAGAARARRRRHRQHRLGQLAHEDAAAVGVRHRQVGDDRADTRAGARPGAATASASTASCPAG